MEESSTALENFTYGPTTPSFEDLLRGDNLCEVLDEIRRVGANLRALGLKREARNYLRRLEELLLDLQAGILSRDLTSLTPFFRPPPSVSAYTKTLWLLPDEQKVLLGSIEKKFSQKVFLSWVEVLKEMARLLDEDGGGSIYLDLDKKNGSLEFRVSISKYIEIDRYRCFYQLSNLVEKCEGWLKFKDNVIYLKLPIHSEMGKYRVIKINDSYINWVAIPEQCIFEDYDKTVVRIGNREKTISIEESLGSYWCVPREGILGKVVAPQTLQSIPIIDWEKYLAEE